MRHGVAGAAMAGLAALALATPAAAADWRLAAESDRAVSYIDMASVMRDGDGVRFARWMILRQTMPSGADTVKDAFAATCATGAYRVTSAEAFDHDRSAGRMPAAQGVAEPGTVLASLVAIACGRAKPEAAPVADPYAAGKARLGAKPAG